MYMCVCVYMYDVYVRMRVQAYVCVHMWMGGR